MHPKLQEDHIEDQQQISDTGNLVGFFDLLLKIDRRVNPELYQKEQSHD